MKQFAVVLALVVIAGCQVNDNTGNVEPTAETQTATAEAAQETRDAATAAKEGAQQMQESDAGRRIAAGAHEAGQGIKQGAGEAAESMGEALANEGREAQAETKPATTTTTTTTTTTKKQ
jgi:hypothetical protein